MTEYIIHYDVMAGIITLIMIVAYLFSPFKNKMMRRVYIEILISVFLSCIFDVLSCVLLMNPSSGGIYDFAVYASTYLYSAFHIIPMCIFIIYVRYCTDDNTLRPMAVWAICFPAIVGEILLFINIFIPFLFRIEHGIYTRLPLMFVMYVIAGIYVIAAMIILFVFWNKFGIYMRLVISLYCFISFMAVIIQFANPNLLIECAGMTVVLLVVYFTIQNQDSLAETTRKRDEEIAAATLANRAKSDFLTNMSHEIRTPISTMLGINGLIMQETDSARIKRYSKDIQNAGNILMSLVNNLLDFSKIEEGKISISESEYEIVTLVNGLNSEVSDRLHNGDVEFHLDIDSKLPKVLYGDNIRLYQVIVNLLNNAIKYTKHGFIELKIGYERISANELNLLVKVKDSGMGIEKSILEAIKKELSETEHNTIYDRQINASEDGIGLTIVSELLALMGTKLEIESRVGVGTEFYFSVKQLIKDNASIGVINWNEHIENVDVPPISFKAKDVLALVVDDNEMNSYVSRKLLNSYGINVLTVDSGEECIKAGKKMSFDMIFMDYSMPGMNGANTMKAFRSEEGIINPNVPIIALTANATKGIKEHYLSEGFDDYISKPVIKDDLENILLKYIDKDKINS